ncbi:RNA 2'-phosphotransferase [Trichocoleus sp. FACHB-90]|uniref:RNA 2'-phosphotransferase n=1 Tax=Cyanophyceae TaxID=3028117 RepID=UPI00168684BA|nr:RNA 2'-phosphotransferase [Trichocoleus sp. FACHB-90]MBD1925695.1 RNA 2'-phosphotransferase [Trichocoleus sp. FACHB-90]
MNNSRQVKISKYLSYILRHNPGEIGLELALGGWISVDELLTACKKHRFPITRAELDEVVAQNDKKRFSYDSTGTLIRANQGHSVEINLQLEPAVPPDVLYHGTGHKSVESIMQNGLRKMSRHHVHLSLDIATAEAVGKRHGRPVVFAVDAAAMHKAGHEFYCSENGVWLVDSVSPEYLQQILKAVG